MKFILNKDKLELVDAEEYNSGSVNYYEADVEFDESWENLTIEARIIKKNTDVGIARSIINNKIYIDKDMQGIYLIGFVGYTIENNAKVYQISSNTKSIYFNKGAGEIITQNEDIPAPTEWEQYIAQLQNITNTINGLSENLQEEVQEVETKLENGDFDGADGQDGKDGEDGITPTIGLNGNWFLGNVDTGKPSRGQDGVNGKDGKDGVNGQNGTNGQDGYSPSASVSQISNGATITITDKNGTTTATVYNGQDGQNGTNGTNGQDGSDGADGFSPIATVTQTQTGATISITDKNGTTTADISNGTSGTSINNLVDGSPVGSLRMINAQTTLGQNALAEGYNTKASGRYSHAEGNGTQATKDSAHAEGTASKAQGSYSHAEGYNTSVSSVADAGHAEGYETQVNDIGAHAEGNGTIANKMYQHVEGKFNISDTDSSFFGKYLHIAGNGTAKTNRSNAYTLDWSGNGWYAGIVSAGTTANPAIPTNANDLTTKQYVDNIVGNIETLLSEV